MWNHDPTSRPWMPEILARVDELFVEPTEEGKEDEEEEEGLLN